jgi:hypothetical protein
MKETSVDIPSHAVVDQAPRGGRRGGFSLSTRSAGLGLALALVFSAPLRAGTIRVGLSPELPSGPFNQQDDGSFHVGSEERPVRLYLDPDGRPWRKGFRFDLNFDPVAGETVISLAEHLQLVAPPLDSDIRPVPMTDWHERRRFQDDFGRFVWLGGKFTVHGEDGFEVAGEVGRGGRSIWFDDFPHALQPTPDKPIDIWIHKEIAYRGFPFEPADHPGKPWDNANWSLLGVFDKLELDWLKTHPIPWPPKPRGFRVVEFATTVPEPGTLGLTLIAAAGLVGLGIAAGSSKR